MWLKTRKMNALLAPLAAVIDGQASDGQLTGSYKGYAVEAWPHSGYPIKVIQSNPTGAVNPPEVNMLRLTLVGVSGSQMWHCQSSAGSHVQELASSFTAGPLLKRFEPGGFKFGGVDLEQDVGEHWGEMLVKRLGIPIRPNADPALQERLIAAGLFDELDALRWGAHPYLPKVEFNPGGRELSEQIYGASPAFARTQPAVEERLRAAGLPDYQSLIQAKIHAMEEKSPGRLQLDVEAGKAKVPTADQFRELLEHAVRIAEINAEANQPAELP